MERFLCMCAFVQIYYMVKNGEVAYQPNNLLLTSVSTPPPPLIAFSVVSSRIFIYHTSCQGGIKYFTSWEPILSAENFARNSGSQTRQKMFKIAEILVFL